LVGCDPAPKASEHPPEKPPEKPALSPLSTVLSPAARSYITTLRVSARVGSVIARKEGGKWTTAGTEGCTVPAERVERALDNLVGLKSTPSTEPTPEGNAFELQIVALSGEESALHFEVAGRDGNGDLVRLIDNSMLRVQGLDRALWTPKPELWCKAP
jgi:hypothetical protein